MTLPDLGGKPGTALLVGTDASLPVALDPFAFFYGQRPLAVGVADTYGSIIGAPGQTIGSLIPVTLTGPPSQALAPALFWQSPTTIQGGTEEKFSAIMPILAAKDARVRVSAITWSSDRMGYAETGVIETPVLHSKKVTAKAKPPQSANIHASVLKPHDTFKLKSGQAMIALVDPIIAAPAFFGSSGATGEEADDDETAFLTPESDELRVFTTSLIGQTNQPSILHNALIGLELRHQGLPFARASESRLIDGIEALAGATDIGTDDAVVAHLILLRAGRENALQVKHWLQSNPVIDGMLARASRLALCDVAPLSDADKTALLTAIDKDEDDDLETRALTLMTLSGMNQAWPPRLVRSMSDQAAKFPALLPREGTRNANQCPDALGCADAVSPASTIPVGTSLALKLAEAAHRRFGNPKLTVAGTAEPAAATLASGSTVTIKNTDTRPLFVWTVTGLPVQD